MPISQSASDPLFAVIGATGNLGGSVIQAIAASDTSNFRVRAITRDVSGAKAQQLRQQGVDIVQADLNSVESLRKAFEDASVLYGMTLSDYSEWPELPTELAQGKKQIDAAVAAGVHTFVWMGLPDHDKLNGGKYPIPTFSVKQRMAEYGRGQKGLNFKSVEPAFFSSNYWTMSAPHRNEDATFTLALPVHPHTPMANIDVARDFGRYVLAAIQPGSPDTILAGGSSYQTPTQMCEDLSTVSGKQVTFCSMPDNVFLQALTPFVGDKMANGLLAMYVGVRENGLYGNESLESSNALLDSPPASFIDTLQDNKAALDRVFV